ncbi:MAG: hypothetical protein AMQ22_00236 [Candidatus Methanofastidiosum methylothiophilum]|uniref:Uncharacterized protein n=1 Tax=Candidatus Methanofastidiosum methylothiophilum TaxID=1705564 RepID=A0A150IT38_9EURY|nr:MAG: hypothetical protein APG11_00809 [Candidatus Methanofastidiosum methylthiophilus]KYC53565.1 MAG: hypothetical protein AMQ22_00236 [Candidatus Methanofastidiosum methylthiophilus]
MAKESIKVKQEIKRFDKTIRKDAGYTIKFVVYRKSGSFICNGNTYTTTTALMSGEGIQNTDNVAFVGQFQDLVVDNT